MRSISQLCPPLIFILLSACAHAPATPPEDGVDVLLTKDMEAALDTPDGQRWALYRDYARVALRHGPGRGDGVLRADIAGRRAVAKAEPDPGLRSRYLSEWLPRIEEAGFLREHVLMDFRGHGNGALPRLPAHRAEAWLVWRAENLPEMRPESRAYFWVEGYRVERRPLPWAEVVFPLVLTFPARVAEGRCAEATPMIDALMSGWTSLTEGTGPHYALERDDAHASFLAEESAAPVVHDSAWRDGTLAAGLCELRHGDLQKATALFESSTRMDPLCVRCYYALYESLSHAGDYQRAAEIALRAFEAARNDAHRARAQRQIGAAAMELGDYTLAEMSYRASLDYEPDNREAMARLAVLELLEETRKNPLDRFMRD